MILKKIIGRLTRITLRSQCHNYSLSTRCVLGFCIWETHLVCLKHASPMYHGSPCQANKQRWPNVVIMLVHHLQCRPNTKTTTVQRGVCWMLHWVTSRLTVLGSTVDVRIWRPHRQVNRTLILILASLAHGLTQKMTKKMHEKYVYIAVYKSSTRQEHFLLT